MVEGLFLFGADLSFIKFDAPDYPPVSRGIEPDIVHPIASNHDCSRMPQIDLRQIVCQGLLYLRVDRFGSLGLRGLRFIEQFVDLRITVARPILSVGGDGFGAVDELEDIRTLISPHE